MTASVVDQIMSEVTAEPTYTSAQAAEFFPRSRVWFNKQVVSQGVAANRVGKDGYFRAFTLRHIMDMAVTSHRQGGLKTDELRAVITRVVGEVERHTGTPGLPR